MERFWKKGGDHLEKAEHIGFRMRYFNQCMNRLVEKKKKKKEETNRMSKTDGRILRYLNAHEG